MELKDKRIIITGSARGMGEATLKVYVQAGAKVFWPVKSVGVVGDSRRYEYYRS